MIVEHFSNWSILGWLADLLFFKTARNMGPQIIMMAMFSFNLEFVQEIVEIFSNSSIYADWQTPKLLYFCFMKKMPTQFLAQNPN